MSRVLLAEFFDGLLTPALKEAFRGAVIKSTEFLSESRTIILHTALEAEIERRFIIDAQNAISLGYSQCRVIIEPVINAECGTRNSEKAPFTPLAKGGMSRSDRGDSRSSSILPHSPGSYQPKKVLPRPGENFLAATRFSAASSAGSPASTRTAP